MFQRRSSISIVLKEEKKEEIKEDEYIFKEDFEDKKEFKENWEFNDEFKELYKIKNNVLIRDIQNLQKYNTWYTLSLKEKIPYNTEVKFKIRVSNLSGSETKFTVKKKKWMVKNPGTYQCAKTSSS